MRKYKTLNSSSVGAKKKRRLDRERRKKGASMERKGRGRESGREGWMERGREREREKELRVYKKRKPRL